MRLLGYSHAMVCANGHLITADVQKNADLRATFCSKCGARALEACECGETIRGTYTTRIAEFPYSRSSYCHACGRPYPWTAAALQAAQELANREMQQTDAAEFADVIQNLVKETPRTPLAVERFKALLEKTKPWVRELFQKVLTEALAEGIAKKLFM